MDRDPFPMRSAEAQRLAASVVQPSTNLQEEGEGGGGAVPDENVASLQWNTMSTRTQVAAPHIDTIASSSSEVASSKGLLTKNSKLELQSDDAHYEMMEDEDDFLDRPLWQSRIRNKYARRAVIGLEKIYKRLYGDKLPPSEMLRTLCLSSTLFFMIGGYWLFRSLKDPILTALCGVTVIPKAKMLSVVVVLVVVSIYNHFLESNIPKHQLFYIFGTFYAILFTTIALLLMHPTIGLANQQPSPWRILGWVSYCSIESFGSVMVSLFWSFSNSNISLESAKASYGVMVATAQLGSILGPTLVNSLAHTWGPAKCYLLGAACMLLLQGTMRMYIRIYGFKEDTSSNSSSPQKGNIKKPKKKQGMWQGIVEGLVLFYKYNYVKGIFAISCLFMIAVTIVDFTLKVLARDYFAGEYPCERGMSCWISETEHGMSEQATMAFTGFMGFFGQATNTLSFLLSLFGTSAVIRYLGLRLTLLLFPSLVLAVIFVVRLYPTLYVVFAAMMTLKANSYALNNPTKEILYQPTSPAVKYKAKSWIDIFGARGSKALGSIVTNAFSDSATNLVANGTLVGMAVASFLIWNATFMGRKFDEYTSTGYIVGSDEDDNDDDNDETKKYNKNKHIDAVAKDLDQAELENVNMASKQNKGDDTSCALLPHDDGELGLQEEGQDESEHSAHGDDDEDNGDDNDQAKVVMV